MSWKVGSYFPPNFLGSHREVAKGLSFPFISHNDVRWQAKRDMLFARGYILRASIRATIYNR